MKIVKIIALFCLIGCMLSIRLESLNSLKSKFDFGKLDSIRGVIALAMKSGTETGADSPFDVCFKLATQLKYDKEINELWGLLAKTFSHGSPTPYLKSDDLNAFFTKTAASENLKDGTNCEEALSGGVDSKEELMAKGNRMKEQVLPYFPGMSSKVTTNVKNFITAFTGVHRFTKESAALIPRLNKK